MKNSLAKRNDGKALSVERLMMNEALERLGPVEIKHGTGRAGRLILALDLTGSREHSLRQARIATAAMFDAIKSVGPVAVRLVYYRGGNECRASRWHDNPDILSHSMRRLSCEAGETQIARVLQSALAEKESVCGMVFVGDHCEDDPDELRRLAKALGQRSMPLFVFHECADHDERSLEAKPTFKCMAEVSGGVYVEFKPDSGIVLREMLSNIAALAAGGAEAVKQIPGVEITPEARQLRGRLLMLPAALPKQLI